MMISYQIFLFIVSPLLAGLTIRHYLNHKDIRFLWQRFFALQLPNSNNAIWFHCASVGEVMTAIPLINLYKEKHPDQEFLISTTTITSARVCENKLPFVTHCYLPLDYRNNIKRFLNKTKPERLIVLETEIWPNLFSITKNNGISITIINGRLSKKTLNAKLWFKKLFYTSIQHVDSIFCRSEFDSKAYMSLGGHDNQVETVGNLKFSAQFPKTASTSNLIQRPYVVAASTHKYEEKKIVELWNASDHGNLLLIIVPRHPERAAEIIDDISAICTEVKLRSKQENVTNTTDVYLADTMGELPVLFQYAEFVIMGGSFVNTGGHNILEPANFGKAIIYGESMKNFEAENKLFLENEAAIQVNNDAEAITAINTLVSDQAVRDRLGNNAKELITKNSNIAEQYLKKLTQ